jgi:hypothetical protein
MSKHDYLVLGTAAVWLVTNFLGAAFTIRRIRAFQRKEARIVGGGPAQV